MRKTKKGLLFAVLCGTMLNICACGAQNNANPEDTAPPAETEVVETEVGSVTAETLRVREEASSDANVIGLLENGQQVTIISEDDEFYHINIYVPSEDNPEDMMEGYVRKDYIKVN